MVPKNDYTLQFRGAYQHFNAATISGTYFILCLDACTNSLGEDQAFTALDALCGSWQVPFNDENKNNSTSISRFGIYHYTCMPFSVLDTPATFQCRLDIFVTGVR